MNAETQRRRERLEEGSRKTGGRAEEGWRKIREREEQDPGVEVRRRISFRATNLIGSFQDDVNGKGKIKLARECGPGQRKLFYLDAVSVAGRLLGNRRRACRELENRGKGPGRRAYRHPVECC
jgi:hypothetical protein